MGFVLLRWRFVILGSMLGSLFLLLGTLYIHAQLPLRERRDGATSRKQQLQSQIFAVREQVIEFSSTNEKLQRSLAYAEERARWVPDSMLSGSAVRGAATQKVGQGARGTGRADDVHYASWSDTGWMADASWVAQHAELQARFRATANPFDFYPQPLVYRPKLPSMGYGNMVYDIVHHAILAVMLGRPFLMSFDIKDPYGAIESLLLPGRVDWHVKGLGANYDLAKLASVPNEPPSTVSEALPPQRRHEELPPHLHLTCRENTQWHSTCGGNQHHGSMDGVIAAVSTAAARGYVLYSEFSASFILPLRNARRFNDWVRAHLGETRSGLDTIALSVRGAFPHLFRPSPSLNAALAPVRAELSTLNAAPTAPAYIAVHVRTGNMEDGRERTKSGSAKQLVSQLVQCQEEVKRRSGWNASPPWLLLSDDVPFLLEARRRGVAVTTIEDASFTLANGLHVGKLNSQFRASAAGAERERAVKAWTMALRDWLLVVEAPGLVLLRNTMESAGSFGSRAAYLGGKACIRLNFKCGDDLFQHACTNV